MNPRLFAHTTLGAMIVLRIDNMLDAPTISTYSVITNTGHDAN